MKQIVLFFYRNDDVFLNLFFIIFFTMAVVNNTDKLWFSIIFGIIDLAIIIYTFGRIFGIIKHYPRVKIENNKIMIKNLLTKKIFEVENTGFTRSTSLMGAIDIIRLQNLNNNKHRTLLLHDLDDKTRKDLIKIHEKYE